VQSALRLRVGYASLGIGYSSNAGAYYHHLSFIAWKYTRPTRH